MLWIINNSLNDNRTLEGFITPQYGGPKGVEDVIAQVQKLTCGAVFMLSQSKKT